STRIGQPGSKGWARCSLRCNRRARADRPRQIGRDDAGRGLPSMAHRPHDALLTHDCLLRRMEPGDATAGCGTADAVLTEATRGITAYVETRYDFAPQVDGLGARVDPDARIRIVQRRRRPRRVEGHVLVVPDLKAERAGAEEMRAGGIELRGA